MTLSINRCDKTGKSLQTFKLIRVFFIVSLKCIGNASLDEFDTVHIIFGTFVMALILIVQSDLVWSTTIVIIYHVCKIRIMLLTCIYPDHKFTILLGVVVYDRPWALWEGLNEIHWILIIGVTFTNTIFCFRLRRHPNEEYTAEIKAHCDATSQKFNLPRLDEPCILKGTITNPTMQ